MTEFNTNYKERYSKEDFLTISPEYNGEKERVFSQYSKNIKLCYTCMGISFGLLFLFIVLFFMNPPVFGVLALIMMILGIMCGVFASINITKRDKALSDLGDKHYRNYVASLNTESEEN